LQVTNGSTPTLTHYATPLRKVLLPIIGGIYLPDVSSPREERRAQKVLTALIFWIVVGLIAGALAKLIMPGDDPGGIIVTIILGIIGAVVGGYLLGLVGLGGGGGFIGSIIAGIVGAVILLAIYRLVVGRAV
jgi:uncharacterized membrane protein YeaQ/YmgE (transglycosylase-associated protein family)